MNRADLNLAVLLLLLALMATCTIVASGCTVRGPDFDTKSEAIDLALEYAKSRSMTDPTAHNVSRTGDVWIVFIQGGGEPDFGNHMMVKIRKGKIIWVDLGR